MTGGELSSRIVKGGFVLVLLRGSIRLIGLISIAVLFRLLTPEDFGIVALAMLVVGFVEVFAEFGFDQALLRNPTPTRDDYDLAWTMSALRGIFIALMLLLLAEPAALILEEPRLERLISILSIVPLLDGLMNIGTVDFAKHFQFHREYLLKVSQKLIAFVVTIIVALAIRDFWALIIGTVSGRLTGLVLSYAMHPYRPRICLRGWRSLIRFSAWILINNIALFVGTQTDKVVVQKNLDSSAVGIVRVAEELSAMVNEFIWPIERSIYAGYVKIADRLNDLRQMLSTSVGVVATFAVPMSIGLGAVADPAVRLLLGEKGAPVADLVKIYVIYGAIRACLTSIFPVFMVVGRPEINAQVTMSATVVRITVLFALFPTFGLSSAPWSMVAAGVTMFVILWWRTSRTLGMGFASLPIVLWRPIIASSVMALLVASLQSHLSSDLSTPGELFVLISAGSACYFVVLLALWAFAGMPKGAEKEIMRFLVSRVPMKRPEPK